MILEDLLGILLFAFLGGGTLTFLGSIIKYFNAGDIINFFDEKKHDKDKVSRIVGRDLLLIGLSVIIIAIISIFVDRRYYIALMISQVFIVVFGVMVPKYQFSKYCKK